MKKLNTRKIGIAVLWIIGLSGLVASMAFVSRKSADVKVEHVNVNILNPELNNFIEESDVKEYLQAQDNSMLEQEKSSVDVNTIEKTLNAHPAIENADIAVDINGDVDIQVKQRTPLFRIINADGESYYIDTQARPMPLSDKYTARVLVATGELHEPYARRYQYTVNQIAANKAFAEACLLDDLYLLADYIAKDTVLNSLIQQINVTPTREFELYPSIGGHKIVFGPATGIEEKFTNLKVFYTEGLNRTNGWNKYAVINIKYKNQVVCTKK